MKNEITTEIVEEKGTLISKVLEFIIGGILPILCIFLPTFLLLSFFPNNIYARITASALPAIIVLAILYYYIEVKGYRSTICDIDTYERKEKE